MTSERLHDLLDLTLAVNHLVEVNDLKYIVEFSVGTLDTYIWVHDFVNKKYISYSTYKTGRTDENYIFDPDLIRGEEHIRRIMEGEHDAR